RLRIGPGLSARLVGIGDEIEAPDLLPVLELEGADPVLGAPVGAGRSIDDEVADDERRHAEILALAGIRDLAAPEQRAFLQVDRDQIAVGGAADDAAILERYAAVGRRQHLVLDAPGVGPTLAAGRRIDGDDRLVDGQIHHAVVNERTG